MKKLLMMSLGVFALMSCSNDDATEDQISIVGIWKESKTVIYSGTNNAVLSTELPDDCDKKNTYEFTSNGILNSKIFYTKSDGTCGEDGNFSESYNYDPATKKILIDGTTTDVLQLNQNELQIVADENDENGDGVNDKMVMYFYR
ncbi:MAG: hypothetical protein K0R77_3026 [Chryseobacterium sp.]|jgi:hypothetical protein|uniref:lipocalin family protein n=1 Tax=Chryseobacterium sp. TaxID=1871047 RepID=UPI0026326A9E|nr:lipocalin family protein [Chryseobacterium sp.]MDF2553751.1 hypothetical protein [Chryseobacterium sp.]